MIMANICKYLHFNTTFTAPKSWMTNNDLIIIASTFTTCDHEKKRLCSCCSLCYNNAQKINQFSFQHYVHCTIVLLLLLRSLRHDHDTKYNLFLFQYYFTTQFLIKKVEHFFPQDVRCCYSFRKIRTWNSNFIISNFSGLYHSGYFSGFTTRFISRVKTFLMKNKQTQ